MRKILLFIFLFSLSQLKADQWYTETLYPEWGQTFRIDQILFEATTDQQHLIIFENNLYGRVLALDGIIQLTEKDEYVYHEMLSHTPLLAHGNARNVLIIGGGDGGSLREVLRHREVERVVLVEIDESVIALSKKYLPSLSKDAFEDPRVEVIIADGAEFVKNTEEKFDVILCDSTDPIGPGEVLFSSEFYGDCHNCLNRGGILVTQNGVPFLQEGELINSLQRLKKSFKEVGFYVGVIPTYVGGFMTFGWATDEKEHRDVSIDVLKDRLQNVEGELKYYTPEVHKAAFTLPKFIQDQMQRCNMLERINEKNANFFDQLVQDYEKEFSPITKKEKDENNKYQIDAHWDSPNNQGFYWVEGGEKVGFCVTSSQDSCADISEFYVVPSHREKGIGKKMAFAIFDLQPGPWQVRQIEGAEAAKSFWRTTIDEYTNGNYEEIEFEDPYWGQVTCQRFKSGSDE